MGIKPVQIEPVNESCLCKFFACRQETPLYRCTLYETVSAQISATDERRPWKIQSGPARGIHDTCTKPLSFKRTKIVALVPSCFCRRCKRGTPDRTRQTATPDESNTNEPKEDCNDQLVSRISHRSRSKCLSNCLTRFFANDGLSRTNSFVSIHLQSRLLAHLLTKVH